MTSRKVDQVVPLDLEVPGGKGQAPVPDDRGDQEVQPDGLADLLDGVSGEAGILGGRDGSKAYPGFPQGQDLPGDPFPGSLDDGLGGLDLGVDHMIHPQETLARGAQGAIVGAAHTGDGPGLGEGGGDDAAGHDVRLVGPHQGDEPVGILRTGSFQGFRVDAVLVQDEAVEGVRREPGFLGVLLDEDDVLFFLYEFPGYGGADHAGADDDDLHGTVYYNRTAVLTATPLIFF